MSWTVRSWASNLFVYEITIASLGLFGCCLIALVIFLGKSRTFHFWILLLHCLFYGLGSVYTIVYSVAFVNHEEWLSTVAYIPVTFSQSTTILYLVSWFGVIATHTAALFGVAHFLNQGEQVVSAKEFLIIVSLELGLLLVPTITLVVYISSNCESLTSICAATATTSADMFWILFLLVPLTLFCCIHGKIRSLRASSVLTFDPDMENKVQFVCLPLTLHVENNVLIASAMFLRAHVCVPQPNLTQRDFERRVHLRDTQITVIQDIARNVRWYPVMFFTFGACMIAKVITDRQCASPDDQTACQQGQMVFHSIFASQAAVFCVAYMVSDSETFHRISFSFFRRSLRNRRRKVQFNAHSEYIDGGSFEVVDVDAEKKFRRLTTALLEGRPDSIYDEEEEEEGDGGEQHTQAVVDTDPSATTVLTTPCPETPYALLQDEQSV